MKIKIKITGKIKILHKGRILSQ